MMDMDLRAYATDRDVIVIAHVHLGSNSWTCKCYNFSKDPGLPLNLYGHYQELSVEETALFASGSALIRLRREKGFAYFRQRCSLASIETPRGGGQPRAVVEYLYAFTTWQPLDDAQAKQEATAAQPVAGPGSCGCRGHTCPRGPDGPPGPPGEEATETPLQG